jgi:hypothetical protein
MSQSTCGRERNEVVTNGQSGCSVQPTAPFRTGFEQGRYFFFGPLLAIGGFGAALFVLLPPFLDMSENLPLYRAIAASAVSTVSTCLTRIDCEPVKRPPRGDAARSRPSNTRSDRAAPRTAPPSTRRTSCR